MPGLETPRLTFGEHLSELRLRAFFVMVAFVLGSSLGFYLKDILLKLLLSPLQQSVFYTTPAGGFAFLIQLSFFFGLAVSLPIITYNVLRFVQPALPLRLSSKIYTMTVASCFLTALGLLFAYLVSLPAALKFLNGFTTGNIQSLISADAYFSFATRYLFGFALVFQLPLILVIINKVVPLRFSRLMRMQGVVLLVSYILAAILTPTPDPINQTIMALPIVLLYQVAVIWICISNALSPRPSPPTPATLSPVPRSTTAKRRLQDISRRN
jgi:sec-independent protein translocase protein TatC